MIARYRMISSYDTIHITYIYFIYGSDWSIYPHHLCAKSPLYAKSKLWHLIYYYKSIKNMIFYRFIKKSNTTIIIWHTTVILPPIISGTAGILWYLLTMVNSPSQTIYWWWGLIFLIDRYKIKITTDLSIKINTIIFIWLTTIISSSLVDLPVVQPVKNDRLTVVDQIMVAVTYDRLIENCILYQFTKKN